jgi:hypothetical protein
MSVQRILETYEPPLGQKLAWKVLIVDKGKLYFPHWTLEGLPNYGEGEVPTGRWLDAKVFTAPTVHGKTYQSGFHTCITKDDASNWTINSERRIVLPVWIDDITAKYTHCPERLHDCKDPNIQGWVSKKMYVIGGYY